MSNILRALVLADGGNLGQGSSRPFGIVEQVQALQLDVLLEGIGMPVEPGTRGVRQETTEGPVHVDRGRRGKP